jgi:hypothetical protein
LPGSSAWAELALIGSGLAPPGAVLLVMVPAWTAALLSMGYAQWRVMRRSVPGSVRWIAVTSAAGLVGVMIPVGALSAVPNSWPVWARAVIAVLAAVAMGSPSGRSPAQRSNDSSTTRREVGQRMARHHAGVST